MSRILCATRGGDASYRTQDAVIERAHREGAEIVFLYVVDVEFLRQASRGVRPDVILQEMERMGSFLLAMACERAAKQGVVAHPVLRRGTLAHALREVALEEKVGLIALGRPSGEASVFQLAGLQHLAQSVEQDTGVPTEIVALREEE